MYVYTLIILSLLYFVDKTIIVRKYGNLITRYTDTCSKHLRKKLRQRRIFNPAWQQGMITRKMAIRYMLIVVTATFSLYVTEVEECQRNVTAFFMLKF
jgi:hypothetical protein